MRRALLILFPAAFANLNAQEPRGGVISGVVRDSAERPIAGAEVRMLPGRHLARTDSAGRYRFAGLDNDGYQLTARKIGWAPDVADVRISAAGHVEVNFMLARRTDLDTVRVVASRACPGLDILGFECRRQAQPAGIYLDYPDIDAYDIRFTRDLTRRIYDLRKQLWWRLDQPFVPSTRRCLNVFVDGRPESPSNPLPVKTIDIVSIEMYQHTDSVPMEDRRALWWVENARNGTSSQRVKRCGVLLYWTIWAPLDRHPKSRISQVATRFQ